MKKKTFLLAFTLSLALLLSACGGKVSMDNAAPNGGYTPDYEDSFVEAPDKYYDSISGSINDSDGLYQDETVKLIRTAELTVQSTDFDASLEALNRLTQENGGYYQTARVEGGSYYNQNANRSAYYVVRIPAENFVAFRDGTGGIGYVLNLNQNAQDVGESYYDTEARLKTLTTKRDRLLALLEEAKQMSDIIQLETELANLQYQIDQHTATLRKYDSLVDYATFTIYLYEVTELKTEPGVKESFGTKFLSSLKAGIEDFTDGLESFALWFARNLIALLVLAVIIAAIVVAVRRLSKGQKPRKNKRKIKEDPVDNTKE